ncbi:MAG TPA: SIS domain-containing protein [Anaerolineae bacterium]|nr:SIS domain-containing protein [Anaerolineae bacterium]
MTNDSPLLRDILHQPQSLAETVDYQFGAGRPALHESARLMNGQRILLSGMGSSLYACCALSAELAQHGVASTVIDTAELLHYHHHAYRDAVAVLVSRSGESVETLKLLPRLKVQGIRLIGVTDVADSTLAREADATVLIHGGKDHLVAVQSYTATLIALSLLSAALLRVFDATRAELEMAINALNDYVPQCVDQSLAWRSFFDGAQVVHLLGRGRSIASIDEGALLFNEVAKFPSVPKEAAQFRHGPVEIVDEHYRAIVFAPNDQTRDLNIALAHELSRLGGQVKVIGPGETDRDWWTTPAVSPALAPLIEIVPVQCAAMRLAEWRGFTPGEFRVATQVTRSESGFDKT